jgi:transcriptional regulator with XRE-family HTH domain
MVAKDLIREARLRAGLTQAQLAERAGKPQSVIARWESGKVEPSLSTVREICRAAGMDLDCHIVPADDSYGPQIDRSLAMTPGERLERSARAARQFKQMRERAIARR